MAKDPAALLYIDTWLTSTAEMDADCRGWYINLTLHQYDKKSLPNDIELIAQLAVVKFSEFERFKQVWEQVLKQKFSICEDGRLKNPKADEIITSREKFTKKRSKSGNIGVVVKSAKALGYSESEITRLKSELYSDKIDVEQAKNKQVLEQMLKLYRNGDVNKDSNIDSLDNEDEIDLSAPDPFQEFWSAFDYNVGMRQAQDEWQKISKYMPKEIPKILDNVPKYVKSKPDKTYRKKPQNYLAERVWMDEIVEPFEKSQTQVNQFSIDDVHEDEYPDITKKR